MSAIPTSRIGPSAITVAALSEAPSSTTAISSRVLALKRIPLIRSGLIVLSVMFAGQAFAQTPYTAPEMQALLAKGLVVASSDLDGGKVFTARITLAAGGQLSGALTPAGDKAIAVSGSWKLKGAQVCRTLAPIQPEEVCETWVKSGPKQATIQVDGKGASVNKWQ